MEISQTFTYVPHHRTLTKSGQSHFSSKLSNISIGSSYFAIGVSDAIAEFIDNSLQATQANPSDRNIRINLELDFYSGASFLTIYDNGKGMNEDDIRRFAKYSDTKQYSNNQDQDPTNISKFGVGSKEAGFYLGDRLHVITKSHECDQAIELVLDENEMDRKYKNDQNVYNVLYLLLIDVRFMKRTTYYSRCYSRVLDGKAIDIQVKFKKFEEDVSKFVK